MTGNNMPNHPAKTGTLALKLRWNYIYILCFDVKTENLGGNLDMTTLSNRQTDSNCRTLAMFWVRLLNWCIVCTLPYHMNILVGTKTMHTCYGTLQYHIHAPIEGKGRKKGWRWRIETLASRNVFHIPLHCATISPLASRNCSFQKL